MIKGLWTKWWASGSSVKIKEYNSWQWKLYWGVLDIMHCIENRIIDNDSAWEHEVRRLNGDFCSLHEPGRNESWRFWMS